MTVTNTYSLHWLVYKCPSIDTLKNISILNGLNIAFQNSNFETLQKWEKFKEKYLNSDTDQEKQNKKFSRLKHYAEGWLHQLVVELDPKKFDKRLLKAGKRLAECGNASLTAKWHKSEGKSATQRFMVMVEYILSLNGTDQRTKSTLDAFYSKMAKVQVDTVMMSDLELDQDHCNVILSTYLICVDILFYKAQNSPSIKEMERNIFEHLPNIRSLNELLQMATDCQKGILTHLTPSYIMEEADKNALQYILFAKALCWATPESVKAIIARAPQNLHIDLNQFAQQLHESATTYKEAQRFINSINAPVFCKAEFTERSRDILKWTVAVIFFKRCKDIDDLIQVSQLLSDSEFPYYFDLFLRTSFSTEQMFPETLCKLYRLFKDKEFQKTLIQERMFIAIDYINDIAVIQGFIDLIDPEHKNIEIFKDKISEGSWKQIDSIYNSKPSGTDFDLLAKGF